MNISEALEHLELTPPFSKHELKKAYREALMVWHPDRFTGNEQLRVKAEARTSQINEAFELLNNIPETEYPYQTQKVKPQSTKTKLPPAVAVPRDLPAKADKFNKRSLFPIVAVLAAGTAAFIYFSSAEPLPKLVVASTDAESKKSLKQPAPAKPEPKAVYWTQEMMHTEIKYHNPGYTGDGQFNIEGGKIVALSLRGAKIDNVKFLQHIEPLALDLSETPITDLRPMQGKKLVELYLEDTKVQDLSPIRGMPLEKLYLSRTPVRDLSALENMPLTELNAVGCPIGDISGIAKCPISMLWLTDCPVENISALKTVPLVSVTLHRTKVKDLSPLTGTALQRLHIAETPVTDLSPLKGMQLTRLVFTPANITAGIEVAKTLPLQEIGTRFDDGAKDLQPPASFWPAYDAAVKAAPKP
jgi:internalin A